MARARLSTAVVLACAVTTGCAGAAALWLALAQGHAWADAERAALRADAGARARAMAADLDRELARAHLWFQVDTHSLTETDWEDFAFVQERWVNRAPFPALIRDWYVAVPRATGVDLSRYDQADEVLTPVPWPDELARLGTAIVDERRSGGLDVVPSLGPLLAEPPAVVLELWLPDPETESQDDGAPAAPRPYCYVIGTLDMDYVREELLPALARRHLALTAGGEAAWQYRVVAAEERGHEIVSTLGGATRGAPDAEVGAFAVPLAGLDEPMLDPVPADAGPSPSPSPSPSLSPSLSMSPSPSSGPSTSTSRRIWLAPRRGEAERERPAWRIELYHPAGSIGARVAAARRTQALRIGVALGVLVLSGLALAGLALRRRST
ncbi:MAG: hypothetical protein IT370_19120 [Deltaproteobacteria bacterium]|nr:hypothetical protein [Deltaproteobacteria bacterium]